MTYMINLGRRLRPLLTPEKSASQIAFERAMASQRSKALRDLKKARELGAKHGIEIERERADAYWVTHPRFTDSRDDPLDGNHFCSDGAEVLAAVQRYVDFIDWDRL